MVGYWAMQWIGAPLTSALGAAEAVKVDPGGFRALDGNAHMLRPLAGRGFQVWELKERDARNGETRQDWRLGARLGPRASGVYSQRVSDLDATPPGIRIAGLREVTEVRRCLRGGMSAQRCDRIPAGIFGHDASFDGGAPRPLRGGWTYPGASNRSARAIEQTRANSNKDGDPA